MTSLVFFTKHLYFEDIFFLDIFMDNSNNEKNNWLPDVQLEWLCDLSSQSVQ